MRYLYARTNRLFAAGVARIIFFDRTIKGFSVSMTGTVLVLFLLIIPGPAAPLFAAEPALPAFGGGAVEVRVYTDYFCGPCGAEEQEVIAVITELDRKSVV